MMRAIGTRFFNCFVYLLIASAFKLLARNRCKVESYASWIRWVAAVCFLYLGIYCFAWLVKSKLNIR